MALFFVLQVLGFNFGVLVSYEQSLVVGCWMCSRKWDSGSTVSVLFYDNKSSQ